VTAAAAPSLAASLRAGDRRALARAITLVESTRADDRAVAEALVAELLPQAGGAIRIGISGPPGVGKSTLIERFGLHVIGAGHRIAVLAIDPSRRRNGGALLGDRPPAGSRRPDRSEVKAVRVIDKPVSRVSADFHAANRASG